MRLRGAVRRRGRGGGRGTRTRRGYLAAREDGRPRTSGGLFIARLAIGCPGICRPARIVGEGSITRRMFSVNFPFTFWLLLSMAEERSGVPPPVALVLRFRALVARDPFFATALTAGAGLGPPAMPRPPGAPRFAIRSFR